MAASNQQSMQFQQQDTTETAEKDAVADHLTTKLGKSYNYLAIFDCDLNHAILQI